MGSSSKSAKSYKQTFYRPRSNVWQGDNALSNVRLPVCLSVCLSALSWLRLYQGHRSNSSAVRALTDGQTDGQTDGRYQVHYLPRFAVDKNYAITLWFNTSRNICAYHVAFMVKDELCACNNNYWIWITAHTNYILSFHTLSEKNWPSRESYQHWKHHHICSVELLSQLAFVCRLSDPQNRETIVRQMTNYPTQNSQNGRNFV